LFAANTLEVRRPSCDATRRSMFKHSGAPFDYFARTAECSDPHEMGTLRAVHEPLEEFTAIFRALTARANRPLMNAQGEC
jgi:hypothetical protein